MEGHGHVLLVQLQNTCCNIANFLTFNEKLGQHDGLVMGLEQHMEIHWVNLCAQFWQYIFCATLT
jgi:hypothetical protein